MRSYFLMAFALAIFTPSAFADSIDLTMIPGQNWKLESKAQTDFDLFLETERSRLVKDISNLDLPEKFENQTSFVHYFYAGNFPGAEYRNRPVSCNFLNKLSASIQNSKAKARLEELTQSGKICIPGDLSKESRDAWTLDLANLIWNERWIIDGDKIHSLESLLIENLKDKTFVSPSIVILKNKPLDGYGYGLSPADQRWINGSKLLSRLFKIAAQFNPNDSNTFNIFGPEMGKLLSENSYELGGIFIAQPSIYISNAWAPDALPELLTHEYGHIYRSLHSTRWSGSETSPSICGDSLQEEAAAEAFAWMNLRKIYGNYPETEIFHIAKLQFMKQFRSTDVHYMGAASLHTLFHTHDGNTIDDLKAFIGANKLKDYMDGMNLKTIEDLGPKEPIKVRLEF